jgi:hypothetical protein
MTVGADDAELSRIEFGAVVGVAGSESGPVGFLIQAGASRNVTSQESMDLR